MNNMLHKIYKILFSFHHLIVENSIIRVKNSDHDVNNKIGTLVNIMIPTKTYYNTYNGNSYNINVGMQNTKLL